jgi:hypothetical protein
MCLTVVPVCVICNREEDISSESGLSQKCLINVNQDAVSGHTRFEPDTVSYVSD